jgi:hypothetical protein
VPKQTLQGKLSNFPKTNGTAHGILVAISASGATLEWFGPNFPNWESKPELTDL